MSSICIPQTNIEHESIEIEAVEKGEWAEFGESKKDYSGLKIGQLHMQCIII